jgi:hypothetical protein
MEATHLGRGELGGRPQRMDSRAPEGLVHVDVAHSGKRALIEKRGLYGCAAAGEPGAQLCRSELVRERLRAEALVQVGIELARLEEQPRAEAPDIPICDVRSVV